MLVLAFVLAAGAADAGETLRGRLTSASGRADFEGYTVWIEDAGKLPAVAQESSVRVMSQVNKSFSPAWLAVRAGDKIDFENLDNVFHNVFSLDKRNPFDLGLYKGKRHFAADLKTELQGGDTTLRAFGAAGKYQIFCNIHPDMVATVVAFDHGYFAQSDKNGVFALPAPPPGRYTLGVDGPRLKEPARIPIEFAAGAPFLNVSVSPARRAAKVKHTRKDGKDYPSDDDYAPASR